MSAEDSTVDGIHLCEFFDVHEKDAAPDDARQAGAGASENRFDITQRLLGLRFDIGRDFTRGRITSGLARDEDEVADDDCRRIGSDRRRRARRCDHLEFGRIRHIAECYNN